MSQFEYLAKSSTAGQRADMTDRRCMADLCKYMHQRLDIAPFKERRDSLPIGAMQ
jgi:hypothetical protein